MRKIDKQAVNDNENLPTGWKKVKLVEISKRIFSGATPLRANTNFWNPAEIPWLTNEEVEDGKINYVDETKEKVSKIVLKRTNLSLIPSNSVILSLTASVGKIAINMIPLTTNQQFNSFVLDNQKVIPKFLAFYLLFVKDEIISLGGLTTFNFISKDKIADFEVSLPPLPEQEKIAEILETVDNAIEKTDKIIEKYKRMKQGLMQELLTKGIDNNWQIRSEKTHKFKDSPLGRIPADWKVGSVTDFAELNPKVEINPDNIYPFIEMDAVPIMGKDYAYLTYRRGKEAGSKFRGGDILLARITPSAENGKALLVPTNIDIGIGSTEFTVFRAKQQVSNNFLFYLLISAKVRPIAIALMEGTSGRQRIPNYVFQKIIKVILPPLPEQERIASVLSRVDAVIEKETAYRDKLSHIKQGLMEDLLTGKVRVTALLENSNNQYQKENLIK